MAGRRFFAANSVSRARYKVVKLSESTSKPSACAMASKARSSSLGSCTSRDWRSTRNRRIFHNAPVGTHHSIGRIPKDSQTGGFGNNVDEELRLFGGYVRGGIERYPSDVSPRMRQALNEALADRIACIDKDNGDRRGGIFSGLGGDRSSRDNHIDLEADQFSS